MKRAAFLLLLTLFILSLALGLAFQDAPAGQDPVFEYDFVVVRAYFDDPALVLQLASWKEPWEVHYDKGYLVTDVTAAQYEQMRQMGFRLEIDEELTAQLNEPRQPLPGQGGGIPGFPCYRTVEETFATATDIVANYPQLATWTDVGDSWEKVSPGGLPGYDMLVLRLTNNTTPGPKPKLFVMSAIHAREYTTAELNTRFAEYLVQNYGSDPDVTWLLDYHEVHLLLHANPDGRKKAETGLLWRKNTDNNYCANTDSRGVDLNRNFEFQWGCCGGSSSNQCSDTYRGPSPASEPETQAVQNYVQSIFPDQRADPIGAAAPVTATGVFIDIHSYSELVLWPWGFTATLTGNGTALQTLGRKFAYFNNYFPEQAIGLYITDGTTDDFAYGDLGVAAYTYELGNSFFESCGAFENTILPDNMPSLLYAAKAVRTPYLTPAGPDALSVLLSDNAVAPGDAVTVTATLNDTRFNNDNGAEPVQNIAAAEYYLDTPPWVTTTVPISVPMVPADGTFNTSVEGAVGVIDTTGLPNGRHMVFVRGQDVAGNWGAISAAFLFVIDPAVAPTIQGTVTAADTGLPLEATVMAGSLFSTETSPATGEYEMQVISGTYDLTAAPASPDYAPATVNDVVAHDFQTVTQDFLLYPYCEVFSDDVESGANGWTAQAPWAITTENAHSPTHSWTDSPGGPYSNNRNVSLTSPVLDMTGQQGLLLKFWQICDTEAGYDYCHVELSDDGGTNWTTIASYDGNSSQWEEISLPAPILDNQPDARIRFRFTSDSFITEDGWHVDDIRLVGAGPACIGQLPPTAAFTSSSPDLLGTTTVFTNTSTGTSLNFVWDFGDGSLTSTQANPSHLYLAAGTYTVTLTVTNTLGTDVAVGLVEITESGAVWLYLPIVKAPPVANKP
ncbi:MAG: PKD domain-containing protein [Chloroflexi bacterium]|nr:PKD domain-containing protein [Chloroflexota bacterium]MCI0731707.1 PKD domain-containing protein [Chloroflexota bacterium]